MSRAAIIGKADSASKGAKTPRRPIRYGVQELAADRAGEWNDYVLRHAEGTLFHTLAWRNAVREAFDLEPVYLTAVLGDPVGRFLGSLVMDTTTLCQHQ